MARRLETTKTTEKGKERFDLARADSRGALSRRRGRRGVKRNVIPE